LECVVTAARAVGHAQPSGASGAETGLDWPMVTASLPVAAAMAGGVQPRGRDGVELPCLVCGELFVARRGDRRTCSPACARRDRAGRAATRLQSSARNCEACGRAPVNERADKRFCSSKCRVRAHRGGRRGTPIDVPTAVTPGLADLAAPR
jgi:hypothetical protein